MADNLTDFSPKTYFSSGFSRLTARLVLQLGLLVFQLPLLLMLVALPNLQLVVMLDNQLHSALLADTASNTAIIDFVSSADWANITHIFVADAVTAGNILFHGALTTARDPASGDTIRIAAGALTLTLA
jgi:hypothetical protein